MENIFALGDELGPVKVLHVQEASLGLKAVLVIDNVAAGPSIGGLRMAPNVTTDECFRLARAMTLKNAMAELPHGGGKSVLFGDPRMPAAGKERLIRAFASALRGDQDYIFGPDMGTNEGCMAWVRDEIGRAVGLPRELGGIPLDEIGATGWGIRHVAEVAARDSALELAGARVVVQGFGAVGMHAARYLVEQGAVLVGAADSRGAIHDPAGLDVAALMAFKHDGKPIAEYPGGEPLERDDIIGLACEIWIPAERPDVVREDNVGRLDAKLIIEGANIPVTPAAERYLHDRGILCIPDFIANAGGVICAAMEYRGSNEAAALATIEEKLRRNTEQILQASRDQGVTPREAALTIARDRVRRAMSYRRWPSFSSAPGWI